MAVFLESVGQLREVDWGASYLWDLRFTEGERGGDINPIPADFTDFFPAVDVEEWHASLVPYVIQGAFLRPFEVPLEIGTQPTLKITFLDNDGAELLRWIRRWINVEIFNNGDYVSPLESCVKVVTVTRMDRARNPIQMATYWVYPKGDIMFRGNSQSGHVQYDVTFVIAAVQGLDT